MPGLEGDVRRLEDLGGRWIGVFVSTGDPIAEFGTAESQTRDRVTADAQKVEVRRRRRPAYRDGLSQSQRLGPASCWSRAATSAAARGRAMEALAWAISCQRRGSPRTARTARSSLAAFSS